MSGVMSRLESFAEKTDAVRVDLTVDMQVSQMERIYVHDNLGVVYCV